MSDSLDLFGVVCVVATVKCVLQDIGKQVFTVVRCRLAFERCSAVENGCYPLQRARRQASEG